MGNKTLHMFGFVWTSPPPAGTEVIHSYCDSHQLIYCCLKGLLRRLRHILTILKIFKEASRGLKRRDLPAGGSGCPAE